jgi:integrase
MTLSKLFREFDLWNAEVRPCTKQAVGVAVRRFHAFCKAMWEAEHGSPAPQDFDVPADEIAGRDISHWRSWLLQGERDGCGGWRRKPVSAHTVHSYHAALSELFAYGLEIDPPLVSSNPFAAVRNKRPPQPEPDVWSRNEIASLLSAVRTIRWQDPTMRIRWTSILYGLLHGERINEITTQRRMDLRPDLGVIFIRARTDEAGKWWQWTAKTANDRAVGISPRYGRVLRRLLAKCPWGFPHLSQRVCRRRIGRIGDLSWRQKQQPYCVVNRDFNRIVAQANVMRLERGQPTIAVAYPHMGRQTAATELAASRVHPKVAAAIMGWSSPETGNRHYIKVRQDEAIVISRSCFTAISRRRQLGIKDSNLD